MTESIIDVEAESGMLPVGANDEDDDGDKLQEVELAIESKSSPVALHDDDTTSCSVSLVPDKDLLDFYRVHRIKQKLFRDSKLKMCSDSAYDVIVCSESNDTSWSTFVLDRATIADGDDDSVIDSHTIQAFEVTLSMSPLQRQLVQVGWISKDSIPTYDGSTSSCMAVLTRNSEIHDGNKSFLGVYTASSTRVTPVTDNVESLWEERKTVTIRCVRHEEAWWFINDTLISPDNGDSRHHEWIHDGSDLLPMIKMNQGSFSFTRIELGT